MKTLIIAEKPSVARDIASALGKIPKQGDYFENDDYVVSAAQGHLVELAMPEDIDKKYSFWRLDNLPIIPEKFDLKPIEKTKSRFQELKKLFSRKDVEVIVNACDAGREGELIFTYIYQLVKSKKPVKRLWMSSMTPAGIREAFSRLRAGEEMAPLADAARCRSESDWLIGINGTRAVTKRMFGSRGGQAATVGRVQTPTLAIVMEREKQIRAFKPRTYYRLLGEFGITQGAYQGIYQRPDFKKSDDEYDRADRIWDRETAERILAVLEKNPPAVVTEERKRTQQGPPRLYDLTTLQREANNRYGLPAGRTLQIAQSLYERYKVITYPRTDSKALPEDYQPVCRETLGNLPDDLAPHAQKVLDQDWVKPNKRIFNNAQVSDHFAIIPTNQTPSKLPENEAKIYDMIARRFIAVFHPNAQFDVTTRLSTVEEEHVFKTEGKVLVEAGWLAVYGKSAAEADASTLPALSPDDGDPAQAETVSAEMAEEQTKPPPRYTEATLLSAMEGAGKLVEDEELAEAMKEKGLGTPATRANIIDHLVREKYLERERRDLIPTGKAELLLGFLEEVKVSALTSASLTGEWEYKLRRIEEGALSRERFMKEITDLTRDIVEKTKNFEETDENARETAIISPSDGKPMLENARRYRSQDGELNIYKVVGNRKLDESEVQQLLQDRRIGPLEGFRSKKGKPFSAILELNDENRVRFVFDNGGDGNGDGDIDFSQLEVIGTCPKCGGTIRESVAAYVCENSRSEDNKCDFRVSRKILGRDIDREQMKKLLENRKTDLLPNFWSKRSKKPFAAHLILKEKGDIGFEFPPRAAKKTATKKTAAKKAVTKKTAAKKASKKE